MILPSASADISNVAPPPVLPAPPATKPASARRVSVVVLSLVVMTDLPSLKFNTSSLISSGNGGSSYPELNTVLASMIFELTVNLFVNSGLLLRAVVEFLTSFVRSAKRAPVDVPVVFSTNERRAAFILGIRSILSLYSSKANRTKLIDDMRVSSVTFFLPFPVCVRGS